jgi:hypothetical protein
MHRTANIKLLYLFISVFYGYMRNSYWMKIVKLFYEFSTTGFTYHLRKEIGFVFVVFHFNVWNILNRLYKSNWLHVDFYLHFVGN